MSPTVFREGPFRFFFFSREEVRIHIHVQSADGEAKFWIEPEIELARNYRLGEQDLNRALELVIEHEQRQRTCTGRSSTSTCRWTRSRTQSATRSPRSSDRSSWRAHDRIRHPPPAHLSDRIGDGPGARRVRPVAIA
jgi:hypothetical protein